MRPMSHAEMIALEGGDFWQGFLCGAGLITSAAMILSPEPVSKLTLWSVIFGTAGACGLAFG